MNAAFLLAALSLAGPARAQSRAASGDVSAELGPNATVGGGPASALGSAPQAVTLNLAAPGLAALGAAPALAAAPVAAPLSAPLALPLALPPPAALLPARTPAATTVKTATPLLLAPVQRLLNETAPQGIERLDEAALLSFTKRLFGEDAGSADAALPAYLRPDRPMSFAPTATAAYRDARRNGAGNAASAQALADAAAKLLISAGVTVETTPGRVTVLPVRDGPPLNRLAWNLKRAHGAAVAYDPARLGNSGVAAFNHGLNTLFLPHFDHPKSYAAVLHESHHSGYAARQARGDLSPFHAAALARGGAVAPGAVYYAGYMSFEELTGHAKTIKHLLAAARAAGDSGDERLSEIDAEVIKAADVSRSAAIIAARMKRELAEGTPVERVPDGHWALPELGPIAGGSWFMLRLPWCVLFLPVLDEPAPARPRGLARLFSKKPETAAGRAARRTADAVLGYLRETSPLIESLHAGLNAGKPSLEKLNALADSFSLAGPRAERAFRTAP